MTGRRSSIYALLVAVALTLVFLIFFQELIRVQARLDALETLIARLERLVVNIQETPEPSVPPAGVDVGGSFEVDEPGVTGVGRVTLLDATREDGAIGLLVRYDGIGAEFGVGPADWWIDMGGTRLESDCPSTERPCLEIATLTDGQSTEGWIWFDDPAPGSDLVIRYLASGGTTAEFRLGP